MKLSQQILDYVSFLEHGHEVDEQAVNERKQRIEEAAIRSNDQSLDFTERLAARIAYRDLKAENPEVTAQKKSEQRLIAGFLKAAAQAKYSSLTIDDWVLLGIPKDVAKQLGSGGAESRRVTRQDVVNWITQQTGSFTKADVINALGGGSPNTIKRAVDDCRSNGMNIKQDNDTYTIS